MKKTGVFLLLFLACGSDEEVSIPTNLVTVIRTVDVANNGNASDIKVFLTLTDFTQLTEARIVLVKSSEVATLTQGLAGSLSEDSYFVVTPNKAQHEFQLPESLRDINGNSITNDVEYTVQVLLVKGTAVAIAELSSTLSIVDVHVLEGRYTGLWNDNLYTNFGISAELTFSNGVLSGPFYYTSTFSACCGGPDDGKISMNIDGNQISSFVYNQVLITFMNGCNGTYNGSGTVENIIELDIDFEGTDCEGPHTGGRITLAKI